MAALAFIFGADDNTVVGGGTTAKNVTYLEFVASGNVVTGDGAIARQLLDEEQTNVVAQAMRQKR